jgi:hypothetical protein
MLRAITILHSKLQDPTIHLYCISLVHKLILQGQSIGLSLLMGILGESQTIVIHLIE